MVDAGTITLPVTVDGTQVGTVTLPVQATMADTLPDAPRTGALVDVTTGTPVWSTLFADHPGCPGDVEVNVHVGAGSAVAGTLVCCNRCRPQS